MDHDTRLRLSFATETEFRAVAPQGCVMYPFQHAGVEYSMGLRDALIADQMGCGKSVQAIGWLNMIGARRPLVVCPASLRINWRRELAKWAIWDPETTVASYNEVSKGLGACTPWDAIVYDECFPGDTRILTDQGTRSLEQIVRSRIPCRVLSFDFSSSALCWRQVTAHYTKDNHEHFTTIAHRYGELRCTTNHPVWVESRGYVRADCILPGDFVRVVRRADQPGEILQPELLGSVADEPPSIQGLGPRSCHSYGSRECGEEKTRCSAAHAAEQSDAQQGVAGEDAEDSDRPPLLRDPGRKWEADEATGIAVRSTGSRGDPGIPHQHQGGEVAQQAAHMLQSGPRAPRAQGGYRGGWSVARAPGYPHPGPKEDSCFVLSRVEGVTVDQLGGSGRPGGRSGEGETVYCLEVAGTNNFFANGVLVHNCHYMKTADSRRTERGLALRTPRRLFLSGTPIANRPIEIWPLLRAMQPEVWGNRTDFGMTYCGGRWDGYEWNFSGSSNLVDLQRRLRSTLMVRRMKSAVLKDLPAKTRQLIELPAESTCKTAELLAAVRQIWKAQQSALTPEAVARLRCDKEVVRAQLSKVRHEEALAKVPAAAAHINDLAESVEKIVVFAHHRDVIAALAGALKGKAVLLQGGMSDHEKQTSVDQFQTDAGTRFLIGNIEAAGVGYTLTAAHTVVFAELDWVPGRMNQCEDRCHRIGQKDNVLVQHLVLDGSLDARISRALQRKQAVIDQALNGEAAPAELDWVATLAEPEKE